MIYFDGLESFNSFFGYWLLIPQNNDRGYGIGLWRGALSSGYQYIRNCDLLIAIIKVSITITYELKFSGLLFLVVVIMTQSQLVSLLERLGMGRTVREITSI